MGVGPAYHLVLKRRGIGDTVSASALVRDLVAARPDVRISVEGREPETVFRFDPRVGPRAPDAVELTLDHRPTIWRAATDPTARYGHALHDAFDEAAGVFVPRGRPVAELVLGPGETTPPRPGPYAVLASGVKYDIPVKNWGPGNFAAVVAATPELNWVQVGDVMPARVGNHQVACPGAENLLGRTSLRDLFRLIAHARVVLCHLSLPALVAAAFGVPCVVVAGGRETPSLFADSGVELLHTVGRLDCCRTAGCLAGAALPGRDPADFPRGWLCADPVAPADGTPVGRCMTLLTPGATAAVVRRKTTQPGASQLADGGLPSPGRVSLPVRGPA